MEAINALGLKPICLLPDKTSKPTGVSSIPHLKLPTSSSTNQKNLSDTLSRVLHGNSLILLSPFLSPKQGLALTYQEALQQSINGSSGGEFDTGGGSFDGIVSFASENPIAIGGALAILAVPLIVSQFLGKPKSFGVESAKVAYAKLGDDPNAQLVDIRSLKDVKEMGSPDIRGCKKKPVSIVYKGDDKPGFLKKLSLKFKEPENTTLLILDKFDGSSELVAELVTANGFKAAYAIKDGAEGGRGWMNSGLPWILPKKSLSLDFGNWTEALSDSLPEGAEALSIETILQVLGSAAIIQVDRKLTLEQVDDFLTTKIGPSEFLSELKDIGVALLPLSVSSKALPAPTEPISNEPSPPEPEITPLKAESITTPLEGESITTPLKAESITFTEEMLAEEKTEAPLAPEINSVPQTEPKVESKSVIQRPLSPYTMYPDLKPPSSPRPSKPNVAPTPTPAPIPTPDPIPDPIPETNSAPMAELEAEVEVEVKVEAKAESHSKMDRPLSPYPLYPDLKPPSSPCPSQP
ncbi:hypothetical protein V2J09_004461 [Rumex salicifolius]